MATAGARDAKGANKKGKEGNGKKEKGRREADLFQIGRLSSG